MPENAEQLAPEDLPQAAVHWRSWPARDNPVHALLVGLGLLVGSVLIYWGSGHAYLTIPAIMAVAASMWRFFVPTVFEFNDQGVDQWLFGRHRHIPWFVIRGYEICPDGILLLPHEDRSFPASFRGLYVPWKEHRDAVLRLVRFQLNATPPM